MRNVKIGVLHYLISVVNLILFSRHLSEIESRLIENINKTKAVFKDEIKVIEDGLVLMRNLTRVSAKAVTDYKREPNLFTNHNLFARNRELLLNSYFCILSSSYGTQNVILRTVIENNHLMRLFNKKPHYAYEWLPPDKQKRFSEKIQLKYGKSKKSLRTFKPLKVRDETYEESKKLKEDFRKFYDTLCNYTHPNYLGWQELVYRSDDKEFILNVPRFVPEITDRTIGLPVYLIKLSIKVFIETFRSYLVEDVDLARRLDQWQNNANQIIFRHFD